MATAPKIIPGPPRLKGKEPPNKDQLRRDRITGIVVLVILAAVMALMIWLASLGNGTSESIYYEWPMMP